MIIVIDFDGTLTLRDEYPRIGDMNIAKIKALIACRRAGHKAILSTCREGESLIEAVLTCASHDLIFDGINDNDPERIAKYGTNPRKVSGDVIIDDKAWGYDDNATTQYLWEIAQPQRANCGHDKSCHTEATK